MIVIEKWAGLATNASPYSIPPGAAVTQVNLQVIVPGQIKVRPGMVSVSFTTHTATTASPYSIPPGAAVTQVNLQVIVPGQIKVRPGMVSVSFTTHTATTVPIVQLANFQHSTFPQVVYQNASGGIYVAQSPA